MSNHKRSWKSSEKLEVIKYYQQHGLAKTQRKYEVSSTSIYKWTDLYDQYGESGLSRKSTVKVSDELAELRKLRKENLELKQLVAEKELRLRIKDEMLKKSR